MSQIPPRPTGTTCLRSSGERMALFIPKIPHGVPGLPVGTDEPANSTVWQQPKLPYQIDTPIQKSMELISSITDLDNTFSEPSTAPQRESKLQNIEEVEVAPIELEDDNSHVICPICYEYLPQAHYTLHRHSRDCHHPSRPPEVVKEHSLGPHRGWSIQGRDHFTRSELVNGKSGWPRANCPPVIRKAKQHEIQYWSTIRGKMTAIYKKALRKPNFDGTYNVNGQITSLQ